MTNTTTISDEVFAAAEALSMMLEDKYDVSINGLTRLFKQNGFKAHVGSGAYRYAVILDGGVIKVSNDRFRLNALRSECEFINTMRLDPKFGRHFPETHEVCVGDIPVLVQEKINMRHDGLWDLHDDVEALAEHLGIEDMHDGNFGWKGAPGREYPVFIDVDLRSGKNRWNRRSWMVSKKRSTSW